MSWHATAWAKQTNVSPTGARITRSEKLLLLCLADYHNPAHGYAWPSVERLAAEAMLSERQARNLLRSLEAKGLVTTERRVGETSRYRLPAMPGEEVWTEAPAKSAADKSTKPKARDIADALVGADSVLDGYLADFDAGRLDDVAQPYLRTLDDADLLADQFHETSKDLRGFLRNAVIARCAADTHGIDGRGATRLAKEAKVLGTHGHRWIVSALLHTASADITGDAPSYVIKTARRMAADHKAVAA